MAVGGIFLSGTIGMANAAPQLAETFCDYGRHLAAGETAWAELDEATFAAQLQGNGSDYFFTMGVMGVMMEMADYATSDQWRQGGP